MSSEMELMKMPEQPTTWAAVVHFLQHIPIAMQGAFMAFVIALLRLIYDGRENSWARKLIEATLCGFLALASGGTLDYFGLDSNMMLIPISAIIGFIGVEGLRDLARKYTKFHDKTPEENDND